MGWVSGVCRVTVIDDSGTPLRMVGCVTDITERKQAALNLLAARNEVAQASKSRAQLIMRMSSELAPPGDFAGQLPLIIEPVNISALVSACVLEINENMAGYRCITIENRLVDSGMSVLGDVFGLRQAIYNLLSGAVENSLSNSMVSISSTPRLNGNLRIEIRDNGQGFDLDRLNLLFSPHARADLLNGTVSGFSVGLLFAKQMIEAMRGLFGVESKQGEGSLFWFELPHVDSYKHAERV